MKKLVLLIICVLFFCTSEKTQAQDGWQIEIGGSTVRFPDENAAIVGEKFLFQFPRLSVTKKISKKFSVNGAISFNALKVLEISQNKSNYFSLDGFLRYSLFTEPKFIDPYVFGGASLVSINIGVSPALNFGAGNTFWISKSFGINSQAMYKFSDKNTSHFQFTAGFVYRLSSGRKNLWD